jgi:malate dehydrogenase (oxaloacetate-decarboxylating)(NADP+)
MADRLEQDALDYHRGPVAGKLEVVATKPLATQRDLSLAYSPGVAFACEAIVRDPDAADTLTARGNIVAVVSNGTAVLGLGAIGPLAGKPVMEGKAVLFKKFAGIDSFDIEVNETRSLEAGRGGGRPRAHLRRHQPRGHQGPDCFIVEEALRPG